MTNKNTEPRLVSDTELAGYVKAMGKVAEVCMSRRTNVPAQECEKVVEVKGNVFECRETAIGVLSGILVNDKCRIAYQVNLCQAHAEEVAPDLIQAKMTLSRTTQREV